MVDFIDRLREISSRIPKLKQEGLIKTEEGTKNALVMPFINALGYNVFDPTEVTPELVADVGTKKGEKVDYAILKDGEPIMLFECKCFGTMLGDIQASQLFRYFTVTKARFGIVTDGVVYQFYTDLEETNKMDTKPFLVFDMLDIKEPLVEELKKFTKGAFDIDQIMSTASQLKYTNAIKKIIQAELVQPSEAFVRHFAYEVYTGRLTAAVLEQFTEIVKRAWREVITDRMKDTFNKAAQADQQSEESGNAATSLEIAPDNKVVTTEEEQEAFRIIRAILRGTLDIRRTYLRDAQSYCSVLLDDNNRKTIVRLHFNSVNKKYLGVFDENKQEVRIDISSIDDIYMHADRIIAAAKRYLAVVE